MIILKFYSIKLITVKFSLKCKYEGKSFFDEKSNRTITLPDYDNIDLEPYVKEIFEFETKYFTNIKFTNGAVIFYRSKDWDEKTIGFYSFSNDDISKECKLLVLFLEYLSEFYTKIYYFANEDENNYQKERNKEDVVKSIELKYRNFDKCDIEFLKNFQTYFWKK